MMAEKTEKKQADKGKSNSSKKWTAYDVSGSTAVRKRKSCPKCGEGVFMAKHKDGSLAVSAVTLNSRRNSR